MSTDLKANMKRDERRRKMLNDPDLTGDLLLFALCLDEVLQVRTEQCRKSRTRPGAWVNAVTALAHGSNSAWHQRYWGRNVIADDIPRYEPQRGSRACIAPMIRREGLCGKPSTVWVVDRDPETGEATQGNLLCSRHRGLQAKFDAREKAWRANGNPLPPANRDGVLKRYWEADWDRIYRWAAPGREPMEGGREATPPRPTFRLIQGEGGIANDG